MCLTEQLTNNVDYNSDKQKWRKIQNATSYYFIIINVQIWTLTDLQWPPFLAIYFLNQHMSNKNIVLVLCWLLNYAFLLRKIWYCKKKWCTFRKMFWKSFSDSFQAFTNLLSDLQYSKMAHMENWQYVSCSEICYSGSAVSLIANLVSEFENSKISNPIRRTRIGKWLL